LSSADICDVFCYDAQKVKRVKSRIEGYHFEDMAMMFKALADPTRLKAAAALCGEEELCVCDVAHIIGSTVATASHHLRLLRNLRIAKSRKEGKLVFYSLADEHIKQIVRMAVEHQAEEEVRIAAQAADRMKAAVR